MLKYAKKFYYYGIIAGLVILAIAIYSMMGKSGQLKELLKRRPKRKKEKMPARPSVVDYVQMYREKAGKL